MRQLFASVFIALTLLLSASLTHAADTFTDPALNADGTIAAGKGFVPCSGVTCSPCDLIVLFNTVLKWFMAIAFLIFAVLAFTAGIKMVTKGSSASLQEAKSSFTNAFIGLFIILAAWLIVDTLLRGVMKDGGKIEGYGPWQTVRCASQTDVGVTPFFDGDAEFIAAEGDSNIDSAGLPVSGGSNCPVPSASTMVNIPTQYTGGASIKIRADILQNFERMYAAAKADNITLKIISGWRSEQMQVNLYNKYNGVSAVAKPCSLSNNTGGSNHNSGTAIDIEIGCRKTNTSCNSPAYRWMKANGGRYGFNNAIPDDTVHWSPTGR